MSGELVTGYLRLVPTVQGIQGATAKALIPATREAEIAGLSSGKAFGLSLNKNLKRVVKGGLAGGALFAGIVAKKGIDRLLGIEDARASLSGLGNDAKTVDKIMNNALDSVRGTAFGMADAGKVAASAVAAGIKPGKDLTKNLKLVADAATIAKVPLGEMGAVFNKVAASNKIQGDVIAQLGDMGIPIVQLLAKELGKTASETLTLASQGKINFATFSKAMQAGLGGAALKSGDTTRGAWANMNASLGRIGANMLTGLFPRLKGGFQSITDFLTPLEAKASDFGESLNTAFSGIDDTVEHVRRTLGKLDFDNIDGRKLGESLATALGVGLDRLDSLSGEIFTKLGDVLGRVDWVGIGIAAGPVLVGFVLGLATGILAHIDDPNLWKSIWAHLPDILIAVAAVAFAPSKLLGPIAEIFGKIPFVGKFIEIFLKGLNKGGGKFLRAVGKFFGDLFGQFWKGLTDGGIPGGAAIGRLASKLLDPLFQLFPRTLSFWLRMQKMMIDQAFLMMRGLGLGVRDGIGGTVRFVGGIPGRILRAMGSLARLLFPRGMEAVDGMISGARGRIGSLLSTARGIPGRIRSAVGDLGRTLYNAGRSIISGLISGITSKLGDLAKKLGSVGNFIKDHKGPPSYDRVMLTPAGKLIMQSLMGGLESELPALGQTLNKVNSALASGIATPVGRRPVAATYRAPVYAPAGGQATSSRTPLVLDGVVVGHLVQIAGKAARIEVANAAELAKTTGGQKW